MTSPADTDWAAAIVKIDEVELVVEATPEETTTAVVVTAPEATVVVAAPKAKTGRKSPPKTKSGRRSRSPPKGKGDFLDIDTLGATQIATPKEHFCFFRMIFKKCYKKKGAKCVLCGLDSNYPTGHALAYARKRFSKKFACIFDFRCHDDGTHKKCTNGSGCGFVHYDNIDLEVAHVFMNMGTRKAVNVFMQRYPRDKADIDSAAIKVLGKHFSTLPCPRGTECKGEVWVQTRMRRHEKKFVCPFHEGASMPPPGSSKTAPGKESYRTPSRETSPPIHREEERGPRREGRVRPHSLAATMARTPPAARDAMTLMGPATSWGPPSSHHQPRFFINCPPFEPFKFKLEEDMIGGFVATFSGWSKFWTRDSFGMITISFIEKDPWGSWCMLMAIASLNRQ